MGFTNDRRQGSKGPRLERLMGVAAVAAGLAGGAFALQAAGSPPPAIAAPAVAAPSPTHGVGDVVAASRRLSAAVHAAQRQASGLLARSYAALASERARLDAQQQSINLQAAQLSARAAAMSRASAALEREAAALRAGPSQTPASPGGGEHDD